MKMTIQRVNYALSKPFVISGYQFTESQTIRVTLEDNEYIGHGEGVGVYYMGETQETMFQQLLSVKSDIESSRIIDKSLSQSLPPGGARNALDCALWDLEAKASGISIHARLGVQPKPLTTVFTIGISDIESMAMEATVCARFPVLKIKLDNNQPVERIEAIRRARPDAMIIIDANQAWSFAELKEYALRLSKLDVAMIEQPLKRGFDEELEEYSSPVLLGADESCLHEGEYSVAKNRYDVINIKLDKCGGLTSALKIVELAKNDQKRLMVGNMVGSSLSMAPSHIIGQACDFIDLDGPLLLSSDIEHGLQYSSEGRVSASTSALWG